MKKVFRSWNILCTLLIAYFDFMHLVICKYSLYFEYQLEANGPKMLSMTLFLETSSVVLIIPFTIFELLVPTRSLTGTSIWCDELHAFAGDSLDSGDIAISEEISEYNHERWILWLLQG